MKPRNVCVLIAIIFTSFSTKADIIMDQKENSENIMNADTGKWCPQTIIIVHPDMNIVFLLPQEDRSGFYNLLFQCKETEEIHLIDTIRDNYRYFNSQLISGKYDAILLYNNGKYIKYEDVVFEKNASSQVNMGKGNVHPSDSTSLRWLTTLRSFNTAIKEQRLATSGEKSRGYIFDYDDREIMRAGAIIEGENEHAISSIDGYFEIGVTAYPVYLTFRFIGFKSQKIKLTASSGLILLMSEMPKPPGFEKLMIGSNSKVQK